MAKPAPNLVADWSAWVRRAIARGPAEAARCGRFLDALPSNHPDLKGIAPDLRTEWSDDLRRAAKGA